MYLRLRLARRLGLLGPAVRLERRAETWAVEPRIDRLPSLEPAQRHSS
jgi:hypothetical protein